MSFMNPEAVQLVSSDWNVQKLTSQGMLFACDSDCKHSEGHPRHLQPKRWFNGRPFHRDNCAWGVGQRMLRLLTNMG